MEPYATKLKREREARRCTSKNRYSDEFTARAMGRCQEVEEYVFSGRFPKPKWMP